jgi:hypothetical protein
MVYLKVQMAVTYKSKIMRKQFTFFIGRLQFFTYDQDVSVHSGQIKFIYVVRIKMESY